MDHLQFGKEGEDLACAFLASSGYQIRCRNYRFKRAEIDIVAQKGPLTVFVEVKTRSGTGFGYPEEDVTPAKQRLIMQAATQYMEQNAPIHLVRYDIIAIVKTNYKTEILHLEDAFY